MKMWKVTIKAPAPIEVECPKPCYPNVDSDGDTIYSNTHFPDEGEAWERLIAESDAWIEMSASRIVTARADLQSREKESADVLIQRAAINQRYREKYGRDISEMDRR